MFEIPDDDLFTEENLRNIFAEVGHSTEQQNRNNTGNSQWVSLCDPSANVECDDRVGSPQSKKMRVLSEVNSPSRPTSSLSLKPITDHSTTDFRAIGVSDNQTDHITAARKVQSSEPDTNTAPRRRSLRKFPGPAGILPPAKPAELTSVMKMNLGTSPEIVTGDDNNKHEEEGISSQASGEIFGGAAWEALVTDLEPGADDVLRKFSVRAMLHKASRRLLPKGKVPLMLGVLDSIDFQGTDASVILRDRTAQMQGTLHREVFKDFSADLHAGAAVVLRQVSVISPSSRTHYLNITAGNIVAIYPNSGSRAQAVFPTSSEHPCPEQSSRDCVKKYVNVAEMEMLEAANAAKQAAMSKLRRPGLVGQASPFVNSPANNRHTHSPGLFSNTRFHSPQVATSGSSNFQRPRQFPSPSSSTSNRFSFLNTNSMSQMRTPIASKRTTPYNVPSPMVNSAHSSQIQSVNSCFYQGQTFPSSLNQSGSSGHGNSFKLQSVEQEGRKTSVIQQSSVRLEPPAYRNTTTSCSSGQTLRQTGVYCNNPSRQADTTSASATSVSYAGSVSNTTSFPRLQATSASSRSASQTSASVTQSSQQSKWSFKHKSLNVSNTAKAVEPANSKGGSVFRLNAAGQNTKRLDNDNMGLSLPLGTSSAAAGTNSASTVRASSTMWDDELDDDILSQLSDDF